MRMLDGCSTSAGGGASGRATLSEVHGPAGTAGSGPEPGSGEMGVLTPSLFHAWAPSTRHITAAGRYPRVMLFGRGKQRMVGPDGALAGRDHRVFEVPTTHAVLGTRLEPPFPDGMERAVFALGCFWGAERLFWRLEGVHSTAVGYAGGYTPNPTYEEVCSGRTGHTEAVLVVFDPAKVGYDDLLRVFWEGHDPTQGMRQGNDVGTQYRSIIQVSDEVQRKAAEASRDAYQAKLAAAGYPAITTEIEDATEFWYAEDYHQQYLHKNPLGYCGLGGTGVSCPVGLT